MSISESLLVAAFSITVVFSVLVSLFVIIRIFSSILRTFSSKNHVPLLNEDEIKLDDEIFSSGTLKLKNVDEPTAALIMAIVSDESGIPLSELCFKSIRLVEKQS